MVRRRREYCTASEGKKGRARSFGISPRLFEFPLGKLIMIRKVELS